ncbi:chemotaxis protein CheD [Vibrio cholerae]
MTPYHGPNVDPQNGACHVSRFYHPIREKHFVKVYPGGVYCSEASDELIVTGLGSCISACMWDPVTRIGGMNHFLLPFENRSQIKSWQPSALDSSASRYGCYAMEMLINQLIGLGARRHRLVVKLFGGAQMLGKESMIGEKNVSFILSYVEREQLDVVAQDLGGMEPRKILFDPSIGKVWLKRVPFSEVHTVHQQESTYAYKLEHERDNGDDAELFI